MKGERQRRPLEQGCLEAALACEQFLLFVAQQFATRIQARRVREDIAHGDGLAGRHAVHAGVVLDEHLLVGDLRNPLAHGVC